MKNICHKSALTKRIVFLLLAVALFCSISAGAFAVQYAKPVNVKISRDASDKEKNVTAQLRPSFTETTQPTSSANSNNYIGERKAKSIALNHAGIEESAVTFLGCKLDYDDGRAEYDVEFFKGNTEYDYEIDAESGTILSYDYDVESYTPPSSKNFSSTSYIGEQKAKSIALSHAGVSSKDATRMQCKLDRDDGQMVYEVEFEVGRTEYEYEIDAISGTIYQSEKEFDD